MVIIVIVIVVVTQTERLESRSSRSIDRSLANAPIDAPVRITERALRIESRDRSFRLRLRPAVVGVVRLCRPGRRIRARSFSVGSLNESHLSH